MTTTRPPFTPLLALALACAPAALADGSASQHLVGWCYQEFDHSQMRGVVSLAAGGAATMGIREDGSVVGWGSNADGQLSVPATLGPVSQISVSHGSGTHVMALRLDGTVACWRRNSSRECAVPQGLSNVVQVSAGNGFSTALRANGLVECWGFSANGQCGPASGRTIKQVTAGAAHCLSLFEDGTVRAWGTTSLIAGIATDPLTQDVPANLTDVASIASGVNHCIAIRQNGTVVCWGRNTNLQCNVPAGLTGVIAAAGGGRHTVALKSDGALVGWGLDWQIYPPPSTIPLVQQVACSERGATAALDAAGAPIVWGPSTLKVRVQKPADLTGVSRLVMGDDHAVALCTDGSVRCWGENSRGQATPPTMSSAATQVAAGSSHSLALLADGSVSAWGWNADGIDQATVPAWVHNATFVAANGNSSIVMIEQQDCDADDRWDAWQIMHGEWDWNTNWLLDSCERSGGDLDMNGELNAADIALILLDFGPCDGCPTDLDGNGVVDAGDLALVMMAYGPVD
jgi:alpha-tubulin suppressor-like RCC1 family protein